MTSLVWLAAPFAEAQGGKDRAWRIVVRQRQFGPLDGDDGELFERDLRAYAGKRVLELPVRRSSSEASA